MTKTPRAAALLSLLLLACLFGLTSCQQVNAEPLQEPPQPLTLTMSLQYYDKLGNCLEVPALSGGEPTEDLALVNRELNRCAQELQARVDALNTSNEPGFLRCLCFPVSGERYLSLTLFEYNEQADNLLTDGPTLHSWVYDREEGRLVTENEILAMAETTLDDIFEQILRQHTSPPPPPEELELLGFLLSMELFTRNEDYNAARSGTRQWDYTGFVPLSREAAEYAPAAQFLRERLWARELEGDEYASFFGPCLHITEVSAVENGWQFGIVNRDWNSNGFPPQFTLTASGGERGWTILEDIPISGG